jgi:hypothetical protein
LRKNAKLRKQETKKSRNNDNLSLIVKPKELKPIKNELKKLLRTNARRWNSKNNAENPKWKS